MAKKEKKEKPVKQQSSDKVMGEEISMPERLLAILLFPFKLAWKILLKIVKFFIKSIILAPFSIIIWLGVIVALVLIFL